MHKRHDARCRNVHATMQATPGPLERCGVCDWPLTRRKGSQDAVLRHLSCRLKARNLDSGLSQLSSCQVMSCGCRKSGRPSNGCPRRNFMRPLQEHRNGSEAYQPPSHLLGYACKVLQLSDRRDSRHTCNIGRSCRAVPQARPSQSASSWCRDRTSCCCRRASVHTHRLHGTLPCIALRLP